MPGFNTYTSSATGRRSIAEWTFSRAGRGWDSRRMGREVG